MPLSPVRIEFVQSLFCRDPVRSASRGLRRSDSHAAKGSRRSCRHVAALQPRHSISKIFRPPRSTVLFELVRHLGGSNSSRSQTDRLLFPQHWRSTVQPDASARNCFSTARPVRFAKHDPLDQIDRDRGSHFRPFQTDQFEKISERLSRIHFSLYHRWKDRHRSTRARRALSRQEQHRSLVAHAWARRTLPR